MKFDPIFYLSAFLENNPEANYKISKSKDGIILKDKARQLKL